MEIDHFAVATPSLDEAVARFAAATGVRPAAGGSHPGKGTRNALARLGPFLYLAIDGPDPAQPLVANNGALMRELHSPVLNVYVVRTNDLATAHAALARRGFACAEERLSRRRPDGEEIAWLSLTVADHGFGSAMPIITQWLTPNHPADDAPSGCRLEGFSVQHPRAAELRSVFAELGLDVAVEEAPSPALRLSIAGPSGTVRFDGT